MFESDVERDAEPAKGLIKEPDMTGAEVEFGGSIFDRR